MKKITSIFTAVLCSGVILSGCSDTKNEKSINQSNTKVTSEKNNDISKDKTEINDENKKNQDAPTSLKIDIQALQNIDIMSPEFIKELNGNHQIGYRGLVKGLSFDTLKKELGDYEVKDLYYKGHGVIFNKLPHIEIIFDDGAKGEPTDDAKVKTIYFTKHEEMIGPEQVDKVWGASKYMGDFVGGLVTLYYENADGTYTEVELGRGLLSGVRKLDKASYIDALRSSYSMNDDNLTLNVLHPNVAEGMVSNFFNVNGLQVGKDASAFAANINGDSKRFGKYEVAYDGEEMLISKVAMDVSEDNVELEALKEVWGSKYRDSSDGDSLLTIYDVQPDDGYITKVTSNKAGIVQKVGVYSDSETSNESDLNNSEVKSGIVDPNVEEVDGVAHYNLPDIETLDFGIIFCTNKFTMNGYKVGDDAGDLIESLGEPVEEKAGRSGSDTYVYDNFEVSIKDGKVFSYIIQPTDQYVSFLSLPKNWDSAPAYKDKNHIRLDNNKTNGFYVEVYDNGEGLVSGIGIFGENYSGR
ncbi:hypothetical protein ACMGE5_00440 [Macrococcus equi]|uniref:hypothetical protein n=1 Tax=Macrococcus equi TaxID=3395462 RepID=UPI0039BE42AE